MKRDMELIRKILLSVEEKDKLDIIELEKSFPKDIIMYNSYLIIDAKLAIGPIQEYMTGHITVDIKRLTWDGHEFLDSIRDEKVFNKIVAKLEPFGNFTLAIIKSLSIEFFKAELGLK